MIVVIDNQKNMRYGRSQNGRKYECRYVRCEVRTYAYELATADVGDCGVLSSTGVGKRLVMPDECVPLTAAESRA